MISSPFLVVSRLRANFSCACQALPKLMAPVTPASLSRMARRSGGSELYLAGFITNAKVADAKRRLDRVGHHRREIVGKARLMREAGAVDDALGQRVLRLRGRDQHRHGAQRLEQCLLVIEA